MKWVKVLLAAMAALALSVSVTVGGAVPADASASASGKKTVASRLAGSEPKSVENCGKYTCTTYHNREKTRILAEDIPPLMKYMAVPTAAKCIALSPLLAKALGKAASKASKNFNKEDAAAATALSADAIGEALQAMWEICKTDKQKSLESIGHQAELALNVRGCVEEEKKAGKTVRVGYTTHPDWCGGD